MKISPNRQLDVTDEVTIRCIITMSLIKWHSTSICFVRSWRTGLLAICIATWLLQFITIGCYRWHPFQKRDWIHISSQAVWVMTLYSASTLDRATTFCFLHRHVNKLPPTSVIISSRTMINKITSPINIRISHNIQMSGRTIMQPFT